MRNYRVALLVLTASVAFAAPVFADNDPTMQQIYDEAKSGHVDQAQQMINQVLRDHPRSAKAHYVYAEILAHNGNFAKASQETTRARQLDPAIKFTTSDKFNAFEQLLQREQTPDWEIECCELQAADGPPADRLQQ